MPQISKIVLTIVLLQNMLTAQWWTLEGFIADTLQVQLIDSGQVAPGRAISVRDNRERGGHYLGIRQINKFNFIPVDQYFITDYPLADYMASQISMSPGNFLVIDYLDIWKRGRRNWILNSYSYESDSSGQKVRDWQWEIQIKKARKQPLEESLSKLVAEWVENQALALNSNSRSRLSPRRYRRQLVAWVDAMILSDGSTILDARLSLPYPNDQQKSYRSKVPGMYYRAGKYHESISIGGIDYQRYIRLSDRFVFRQNATFRSGFNSFDATYFDYIDWWNIILINVGLTASVEYRAPYLKGFYGGAGVHYSYNFLPVVVTQSAIGLFISAGLMLP